MSGVPDVNDLSTHPQQHVGEQGLDDEPEFAKTYLGPEFRKYPSSINVQSGFLQNVVRRRPSQPLETL